MENRTVKTDYYCTFNHSASTVFINFKNMAMKPSRVLFTLLAFCLLSLGSAAQSPNDSHLLQLVSTIPLPGVNGRMDHLAFDAQRHLLFVAALGNNTVEVIDLNSKKVIRSIQDMEEPQGLAYLAENNTLVVANGGNGECCFFDGSSFQKTRTVKLAGDADNVRYDATAKRIYVGYGNGGIAVVDASTYQQISDIKLSGHPESFQLDRSAHKIYVNVPDQKQIEVIDLANNKVTDRWPMTKATANFPMALDEANHRLLIGCRHPARLVVVDTQTGKTISDYAIGNDIDDLFYDPSRKQLYLSCGSGEVDIFSQKDADNYTFNAKVTSHSGARTSLFLPDQNLLIVASPSGISSKAALLVYRVK